MPIYFIGPQAFIEANRVGIPGGVPELVREEVEVFQRPGVAGSAVRRNGFKGVPFQVRTRAYALSAAAAWAGFDAYRDMVGTGPWTFVFEGQDFGDAPLSTDVMVLSVSEPEVHKVYNLIVDGSVIGTVYLGDMTWDLLPVEAV